MGVKRRFLCAVIVGFGLALAGPVAGQTTRSILDGAFTVEQASRGAALYGRHCQHCHLEDMQGGDIMDLLVPAIGRSAFGKRWSGDTLGSVMRYVSKVMPFDEAGTLDAQTYADVLAYVLQFSGYPAGNNELPADVTALQSIAVERVP